VGASWRTTVDPTERPALVTTGPFRIVRNPVYAAVAVTVIGLALTVPNLVALVGVVAVIVGCQAQVQVIEEPYLRRVHGTAFAVYTTRVGRFLPGLGRAHVGSSNLTVPGGHGPLSGS
jgi:protein-S-isoprenylcysteine O-methyltransferase Ste14